MSVYDDKPAPALKPGLQVPPAGEHRICARCTAANGAHYLTCPTLRLPQVTP